MTDLDRRIRDALGALPEGAPDARRRAERAALDALPSAAARRRPRWILAAAAMAAAAAVAGVALAATDRLEVRIGPEPAPEPVARVPQAPPPGQVRVPAEARGLALVAGGRLWLGTRSGLGVQRLAASTAELSPNALFTAAGLGDALVAMAPDGRRAWSVPTPGEVAAIAWAPNPIAVAYVVRRGDRHELRVIEGDGDGDRLVDPDVRPVRPAWRADTQALAYVGRGGAVRVAAYPSLATSDALTPPGDGAAAVAYAPGGDRLAVATATSVAVAGAGSPPAWMSPGGPRLRLTALAWASPDALLVAGQDERPGGVGRLLSLPAVPALSGKAAASRFGPPVRAIAIPAGGGRPVVAVALGARTQVWEIDALAPGPERGLAPRQVLLDVAAPARTVGALSVR